MIGLKSEITKRIQKLTGEILQLPKRNNYLDVSST